MKIARVEAEKNIKSAMAKTLNTLLFLIGMSVYSATCAQVTVYIDETINEQLRLKNAAIDTTKIEGFRIQIAFSTNQSNVKSTEAEFKNTFFEYTDIVYSLYQQPYWKIRVGNFYREIDAQKMLKEVRKHFPNAFVVKDNIQRPIIN